MQKDAPNDQELTLKKRARRRLVGAIALVLLMIIVLPMILKDRSVSTPTEEVTITLSNQNTLSGAAPAASDFDSNIVPTEIKPAEIKPSENNPAEAVPLNSESVVDEPVSQAPPPPPMQEEPEIEAADSEASPAQATAPKTAAKAAPKVALAQPKTETPQVSDKKSTNSPKFYVQIGVFSDEANVKKLQAKLSDIGYASQTEKIDTAKGKKIRLRTNLLGERNEAAIALQNIKDAGLTGMVVSQ